MNRLLYHYTKCWGLWSILKHYELWPAPPLQRYGLDRRAVELDPAAFGFRVRRLPGARDRRFFVREDIPHPGGGVVSACWYEGQVFDVAFTQADWCHSVMSYFPGDLQEGGAFWRLVVDLDGLDIFGWESFQQRLNVPGVYRRGLAEATRRAGDDPGDWYFVGGAVPLAGRLVEVEQFHRGRWTKLSDVFEREPLAELAGRRLLFEAVYDRPGLAAGRLGTSLFRGVTLDKRAVADHVWVQQTWAHLKSGDHCRFIATVLAYKRRDGSAGWTLGDVNGLEVISGRGSEAAAAG